VKVSNAPRSNIFTTEAHSLTLLREHGEIRVPRVIAHGNLESGAFLVLEYLFLKSRGGKSDRSLGRKLALLHSVRFPDFGWFEDNYIGATPQLNTSHPSWAEFWRDCRIGYQLELAGKQGYSGRVQLLGERLLLDMASVFTSHHPYPSLLHGDLWSGNVAALSKGEPVIFDPACYRGDREADLAMTELFGGFSPDFYAAYQEIHPLQADYEIRKLLYNLYHVLNHLNLFGGGYLRRAETMMERLLSKIH